MKQRSILLNLQWYIAIVLFLLFFQFFGAVFTIFELSLGFNIAASSIFAAIVAFASSKRIELSISAQKLLILLVLTVSTTALFLLRINWGLFDFICPTGLLGLVTQVQNGIFPVHFISHPDFPMNYHQGFIYLAGTFSYLTPLSAAVSIKLTYLLLFALINIGVMLYFLVLKNKYYFLLPILFIFVSSISPVFFLDLGSYNYINIAEYMSSNSWPLGILAFLAVLFHFINYKNTPTNILILFLIFVALSTANATLFSLLLLSGVGVFLHRKLYARKQTKHLLLYFSLLVAAYMIPKYIPSVFMAGEWYAQPEYGIRLLEAETLKYIKQMIRYLLLSGPALPIGLFGAYVFLRRKSTDIYTLLSVLLLISLSFPFVFIFKNIDAWDNLHKFAVANLFVSLFIATTLVAMHGKRILFGLLVCAILSLPATYDLAAHRLSINISSYTNPNEKILSIVNYLENSPQITTLIPFEPTMRNLCHETGYSAVAQYAGKDIKNAYFTNFLLSTTLEAEHEKAVGWGKTREGIRSTLSTMQPTDIIIVDTNKESQLILKEIESHAAQTNREVLLFGQYLLY